jgi:hypothetical protein
MKSILLRSVNWLLKSFVIVLYTFVFAVYFGIIVSMTYGIVKETIKGLNPPSAEELTN